MLDDFDRDLAADLRELALEVPQARLLRVAPDDVTEAGWRDAEVGAPQSMLCDLLWKQVPLFGR